jgi:hypothetical protein
LSSCVISVFLKENESIIIQKNHEIYHQYLALKVEKISESMLTLLIKIKIYNFSIIIHALSN